MSKDVQLPEGRALVVGLGNPGARYAGTRHNIGFAVVAALAARWGASPASAKFNSLVAVASVGGRRSVLMQPQSYMNLSGESVQAAQRFFKLQTTAIVVLHDDIDLPTGSVKLKIGGGHGGHNGLRSCDNHLPSREYFRVRLGVGRPPHPSADVSKWVLGRFGASERALATHLIDTGADAVEELLGAGLLAAQGRVHPIRPPG